jgi:uncharacterized protein YbjT (DUF2867 family)
LNKLNALSFTGTKMKLIRVMATFLGVVSVSLSSGCSQAADQPASPAAAGADVVLVAGATGRTGREIVTQLLERGQTVRVLSRSEESARTVFGDAVQVAVGDVRDADSLASAMAGIRYVVSAIGSNPRADPTNTPEAVDFRGVKSLVDAAVAAGGVEHFVLVSSMGITQPTHPLNRFADNILLWKGLGENSLRFSGLNYTIVRPGGLVDEPGGVAGVQVGQGDTMAQGMIPRADVATVCVEALGNTAANRKTLEVVRDESSDSTDWSAFFAPLEEDPQVRIGG